MSRNKSFDPDEIMKKAMELFWEKGYSNTSLADLEKVTQLNRVSLYNIYKNKEHLFEACMDKYAILAQEDFDRLITSKGLKGLIAHFERFQKKSADLPSHIVHGCLMVNSCLEGKSLSSKIRTKIKTQMAVMTDKYIAAIEYAKQNGEISSSIDSKANAQYFVTSMYGIVVQVRLTNDILAASTAAGMVIQTIKSWKK